MSRFKYDILEGSGCASSPETQQTSAEDLKTCGKCVLCKYNLNKSSIFTSTVTGESFSVPHYRNIHEACRTKNVVYLITCNKCQMQYVGKTTNELRTRISGHRSAIKNSKIQTEMYCHFL